MKKQPSFNRGSITDHRSRVSGCVMIRNVPLSDAAIRRLSRHETGYDLEILERRLVRDRQARQKFSELNPPCRAGYRGEIVTAATVVDHIEPRRPAPVLGPLELAIASRAVSRRQDYARQRVVRQVL